MINKKEILKNEIELIKLNELKEFAYYCLEKVPDYFFKVPASSSGKYHPTYTLGKGGLIKHVKAAVKIAESLLSLEQNKELNHDIIIFALIFHDCCKHGFDDSGHTEFLHPIIASKFIWNLYLKDDSLLCNTDVLKICSCIESHMGEWNTSNYEKEKLPKPISDEEQFVHLCDYLASRKFINMEV